MFIYDISINSKLKEEYALYLRINLEILWKENLYAKILKCEVWLKKNFGFLDMW